MSDSATQRAVAHQAPLSMGFSRQEYWSGLPFPPPEDIPDPGMEPMSPALQVDSLPPSHEGNSQQDRTELINSLKGTGQLFTNSLLESTDINIKKFFTTTVSFIHFYITSSTTYFHIENAEDKIKILHKCSMALPLTVVSSSCTVPVLEEYIVVLYPVPLNLYLVFILQVTK